MVDDTNKNVTKKNRRKFLPEGAKEIWTLFQFISLEERELEKV